MPGISGYLTSEDRRNALIGHDIQIETGLGTGDIPARIIDVEKTDEDDWRSVEATVSEHLRDKTRTVNLSQIGITLPPVGQTYKAYWGEEYVDGEWTEVTDIYLGEPRGMPRKLQREADSDQTRVRTETYTVGSQYAEKGVLRVDADETLSFVPEGSGTLRGVLSTLAEGDSIEVSADGWRGVFATVKDVSPEAIDFDPQGLGYVDDRADEVPDEFTVLAEDEFGGTVKIGLAEEQSNVDGFVGRYPPEGGVSENDEWTEEEEQFAKQPVDTEPLKELTTGSWAYRNLEWLDTLRDAVEIPEAFIEDARKGSVGYQVGEVWTHQDDPFRVYHISVDRVFQGDLWRQKATSVELATEQTPNTFGSNPHRFSDDEETESKQNA